MRRKAKDSTLFNEVVRVRTTQNTQLYGSCLTEIKCKISRPKVKETVECH